MNFNWKLRRFWWTWIKNDLTDFFYKWRYGFKMGLSYCLRPTSGKGKYVSVYSKGKIIQIIDETNEYDEIRIIPYQPNHGIMVEKWKDNKCVSRFNLDIKALNIICETGEIKN